MERKINIANINKEIEDCTLCNICNNIKKKVYGTGSIESRIVLVGDAPNEKENKTGIAFCDISGALLDEMLNEAKLSREKNIYITNIIKCIPNNKIPNEEEINNCIIFFKKQIKILKPKIIISVGEISTAIVLDKNFKDIDITRIRGKKFNIINNSISSRNITVIPIIHPAYIRNNKERLYLKAQTIKDLKQAFLLAGSTYDSYSHEKNFNTEKDKQEYPNTLDGKTKKDLMKKYHLKNIRKILRKCSSNSESIK